MNSTLLTDKLVEAIESEQYDVIICNYPNGDMVGHSGVFEAAVKACEAVDTCIGRVVKALEKVGGEALITADHGNIEQLFDKKTRQPHRGHTTELVPLVYLGNRYQFKEKVGTLADVAPTLLYLLGIDKPKDMTGECLLEAG